MERKKVMPLDEELGLDDAKLEKKRLKEEKKKLKAEQKEQKKLAKQRAREIDDREDELSEGEDASSGSVFAVTFVIVLIWIAILCLIIKLDFGGFGSNVLAPVLKDVPIINMILPSVSEEDTASPEQQEEYGGYSSLKDAVDYIKELELELERAQTSQTSNAEELAELKAQVERLKTFEDNQVDFQRVVTEFYEEVVYADKGPGIEEYRKYYEEMNPATAEYLYKQVIQQSEESKKISEYVESYSSMKPASAAAIFAQMTDNLDLVSRILGAMDSEKRGSILAAMDPELASRLTKMMDPES
jgi:flagellar motility protein MotE (MotC chaperone)